MVALALMIPLAARGGEVRGASSLQRLEGALLSGESATAILARWCADLRLADPPRVVALRDAGAVALASPRVRRRLQALPGEAIAFRRVRLACGAHVLSQADNWYLPDRLTPAMNAALEGSDAPFGQVVRPLRFHRVTLAEHRLAGRRPSVGTAGGSDVLRLDAVLVGGDGRPFAFVQETYKGELLALRPDEARSHARRSAARTPGNRTIALGV